MDGHYGPLRDADSNIYTQLFMARESANRGVIGNLTQVVDSGWNEHYVERNFLFNRLTGLAYRLAHERGVFIFGYLCEITLVAILFLFAARLATGLNALLIFLVIILGSPLVGSRLAILSPQLLTSIFFCLILFSVVGRRRWQIILFAALFSLSSQAIYILFPLIILLLLFCVKGEKGNVQSLLALFLGLTIGSLFNPFFPENLKLTLLYYEMLLNVPPTSDVDTALQTSPFTAISLLRNWGALVLLWFAGNVVFYKVVKHGEETSWNSFLSNKFRMTTMLSLLAAFLIAASIIVPDGILYALAALIVFLSLLYPVAGLDYSRTAQGVLLAAIVLVAPLCYRPKPQPEFSKEQIFSLLERLPTTPTTGKVYICEPNLGGYLLYARPNLEFVDLENPFFLHRYSKMKFGLRAQANLGLVPYQTGMLNQVFRADYYFCPYPWITRYLLQDPHFRKVINEGMLPNDPQNALAAFEIPAGRLENFVVDYEFAPRRSGNQTFRWTRHLRGRMEEALWSPFLSLTDHLSPEARTGKTTSDHCYVVRPYETEYKKHWGSAYLGIGGGRGLQVQLNGAELYRTEEPKHPSLVHMLIPLPKKLSKTDRISVVVCSPVTSPFIGVSISFWMDKDLNRLCPNLHQTEGTCFAPVYTSKS